jgi:(p)ppGpp synthase/HD superfamily hydrolase
MNKIQRALNKAYELHTGFRKGTNISYFVHILDVTKYLMYETNNEDIICAGILHDTLEDTSYTKDELINDFGLTVYNLVKFSTEDGNTLNKTSIEMKNSWKKRKLESINKLKDASFEELLVYTVDKLSNITSISEDLIIDKENYWDRFNASREEIKWYYYSILSKIELKLKNTRVLHIFRKRVLEVFG